MSSAYQAHIGEFQELAWLLKFDLIPELTAEQYDDLLIDFMDFAEENQLGLAGYRGNFLVVSIVNRKAVTAKEQQLLKGWLAARSEVRQIHELGSDNQFIDAWLAMLVTDFESKLFEDFFS